MNYTVLPFLFEVNCLICLIKVLRNYNGSSCVDFFICFLLGVLIGLFLKKDRFLDIMVFGFIYKGEQGIGELVGNK